MPLFLMVSGLFAHRAVTSARECGTWLLVKARQLLLPCIAWGLLMSFGNLLLPLINGTHPDKSLLSTLWTNFWFLKSLFICFCLWYASLALLRKPWLAALVSILISQCIVAQEVQWSYPSFVTGVLIGAHLDDLRRYRKPVALAALLIQHCHAPVPLCCQHLPQSRFPRPVPQPRFPQHSTLNTKRSTLNTQL